MKRIALALALAFAASAPTALAASASWQEDATQEDARRLERLDRAWTGALRDARRSHSRELRALGPVADPSVALSRPQPTPGAYRCRTIKLGTGPSRSGLPFVAYGWFRCRVDLSPGGDLTVVKTTGSQRPMGHLYPDRDRRLVYLGAVAWGAEKDAVYGRDPQRDQIGVVERIGPQAWRLALPYPKVESTLDLIELRR